MQERRLLIVIFGDESNCSGVVSMHKLVCFIAMAYNMIDAVSTELYRVVNFSTSAAHSKRGYHVKLSKCHNETIVIVNNTFLSDIHDLFI